MNRTVIQEGAISAAKAYHHATVEPRHVLFALARQFREHEEAKAYFAAAKAALEPRSNSYGSPTFSDEARTLLDSITNDDEAIAALRTAYAGKDAAAGGPQTQSAEQEPQESATDATAAGAEGETVADVLKDMDALIGLGPVKAQVRKIIAVVQANTEREKAGLKPVNPGLHLVFTGPPGTGKTTVARIMARLYAAAGALPGSNFTEATRTDLVAGYVGQTAIKTKELIDRTRPGVLFIDEAYSLTPRHEVDYGHEAIATLVKAMEDHRDQFAVIVAGYEDQMADFIGSNPGLRSRFKTYIAFPDYKGDELTEIFERMAADAGITLGEGTLQRASEILAQASGKRDFGNARFARSLFEQAYARMASRAAEDGTVSLEELATIGPADIEFDITMFEKEAIQIGFARPKPA